jgi:hypothetical protein
MAILIQIQSPASSFRATSLVHFVVFSEDATVIAESDRPVTDADADGETAVMDAPNVDHEAGAGPEGDPSERRGSRWNSMKHGLMAKVLFEEDLLAEITRFTTLLTQEFRPATPYEVQQIAIMGRAGAQLDRLRKLRVADMQRAMDRAAVCWDTDRWAAADKLAARLSRDCGRVSSALAQTKQGASWLLNNWVGLQRAIEVNGAWDEEQCRLACDMLGIRPEVRCGGSKISPVADAAYLAKVAEQEISRLEELLENSLIDLDECAQAMAMAGLPGEPDAETRQHRKYEASARREYEEAKAELLASRARGAAGTAGPDPEPEPPAPPDAAPSSTDPDPDPEQDPGPEAATEPAASAAASECLPPETAPAREETAVEPAATMPQPQRARVATSFSRAAAPNGRRQPNRKARKAMEKQAREAARRKGR